MKSTSEYVQRLWTTWYIDLFISQRATMQGALFKSLKKNEDFLGSVLGAIDGRHIPIEAPIKDPEQYINRKGFYSVQ